MSASCARRPAHASCWRARETKRWVSSVTRALRPARGSSSRRPAAARASARARPGRRRPGRRRSPGRRPARRWVSWSCGLALAGLGGVGEEGRVVGPGRPVAAGGRRGKTRRGSVTSRTAPPAVVSGDGLGVVGDDAVVDGEVEHAQDEAEPSELGVGRVVDLGAGDLVGARRRRAAGRPSPATAAGLVPAVRRRAARSAVGQRDVALGRPARSTVGRPRSLQSCSLA